MLTRKFITALLIIYAVIFALCMIGWGVLAGLSRDGAMSNIVHRYVMLALVTVTCSTVAATLQLATVRVLRALLAERGDEGYADGYAEGYRQGVSAHPTTPDAAVSRLTRTRR